jgi:hypothetical protein
VEAITPFDFVTERSPDGLSAAVSVDELFPGVGSVTPSGAAIAAEFASEPVAPALTVPMKVTDPVTVKSTSALIEPTPDAGQVPPVPTQVQVAPVIDAGITSVTVAPTTGLGPAFVAVIR